MLGSPCSPCCGGNCPADGKDRTDPKNEGTWVPSGEWPSVTWAFSANPGDESGTTWFFYGSGQTSVAGRAATTAEQQDWGNLCNWYSHTTAAPISATQASLTKRATRLPDENAVIYALTPLSTSGTKTVSKAYFLPAPGQTNPVGLVAGSELITTSTAHGATGGAVFLGRHNDGTVRGGALFSSDSAGGSPINRVLGVVFGGAVFRGFATRNEGVVNGFARFLTIASNSGVVNGNAEFVGSGNGGSVSGNASFSASDGTLATQSGNGGTVAGFATFTQSQNGGIVNGGASFTNDFSFLANDIPANNLAGTVNGGATFNSYARNDGTVNGGAVFNNFSRNTIPGTVNGGAVLNDAACSLRVRFDGALWMYVLHPSDLPTCNGSAQRADDWPGPGTPSGCGCG